MKEILYNFSCGCVLPRSKTRKIRRDGSNGIVICPEHKDSYLLYRTVTCQCGALYDVDKTSNFKKLCSACLSEKEEIKKAQTLKKRGKGKPVVRIPNKTKILRGKYHCRHYPECSKESKINCIRCDKFEAVFFGYDPKPLHDLIWAA